MAEKTRQVLNDPRGWLKYGYKFVEQTEPTTDKVLHIIFKSYDTILKIAPSHSKFSYYRPAFHDIHINMKNWNGGSASSLPLDDYRSYVINHEVGHALGLDHAKCPKAGGPGSVMQQMTRGPAFISPCIENAWPLEKSYYNETASLPLNSFLHNPTFIFVCIMLLLIVILVLNYSKKINRHIYRQRYQSQ
jgi:hypothetical protein